MFSACHPSKPASARSNCSTGSASVGSRTATPVTSPVVSSNASASRALAIEPKVVLFDEVTSALDPDLVGEVLGVVKQLAGSTGIRMLIVTHEMASAQRVANRIVFLENRHIIEQVRPEQIFTEPRTERCRRFLSAVLDPLGSAATSETAQPKEQGMQPVDRVLVTLDELHDQLEDALATAIAIPSVNSAYPGVIPSDHLGRETYAAEFFADLFRRAGADPELLTVEDGRATPSAPSPGPAAADHLRSTGTSTSYLSATPHCGRTARSVPNATAYRCSAAAPPARRPGSSGKRSR